MLNIDVFGSSIIEVSHTTCIPPTSCLVLKAESNITPTSIPFYTKVTLREEKPPLAFRNKLDMNSNLVLLPFCVVGLIICVPFFKMTWVDSTSILNANFSVS